MHEREDQIHAAFETGDALDLDFDLEEGSYR
jgi:hypothetical protein